jgi:hypothetical protein
VSQLGANALREVLEPGRMPDCYGFIQTLKFCCNDGTEYTQRSGWCIGVWFAPPCRFGPRGRPDPPAARMPGFGVGKLKRLSGPSHRRMPPPPPRLVSMRLSAVQSRL